MAKVLVSGGRDFNDWDRLKHVLNVLNAKYPITAVIQGGARGADALAKRWAVLNGVQCDEYAADWDTHGRSAGHIRNSEMLKQGAPDYVVAFPGGKGTAGVVSLAQRASVPTWVLGTQVNRDE